MASWTSTAISQSVARKSARGLAAGASLTILMLASAAAAQGATTPPPGAPATEAASAGASTSGDASTLQEVVVTAQRRSENLQRVPIAVTSLSGAALAAQQVGSTLDLGRVVPNMFASQNVGQASANVYYIRGLGQTQSFPTFEPQVGTYVDDIYIARQNANNFALFGVEQVQVLRGPQGTLFGRNSTGGAILVTLQKPAATFGGNVDASYGAYDSFSGRASVDLPISDEFRTRTSIYGLSDGGYVRNLTNGETLNAAHNIGVREALRFLPSNFSNIEWNVAADYQRNDAANVLNTPGSQGANGSNRSTYTGFSQNGGALAPFLTGAKSKLGQGVLVQSYGIASDLRIKFDPGTLNIITGFRGLNQATAIDFPDADFGPAVPYDQSTIGQFTLAQALRSYQFSQELKFSGDLGSRFNYTAGLFYLYEVNRNNFGAAGNLGGLFGVPNFPLAFGDEFAKNQTLSEAVYAQGDYKITPDLTLTFGGRFTKEIKSLAIQSNTAKGGFNTTDVQKAGYSTHLDADEFTPRVAVQYQVNPLLMVFASATRGFQGGGWNGLAFSAQTYNNFGPETVWSYEGGFRSETPDHKLRLNGTLYYANINGYQLLSDLASAGGFVTNNAASLESYGAEFDLTWKPIEHLTLTGNLGLQRALYFNPSDALKLQQGLCKAKPGAANPNCGTGIVRLSGDLADPTYTPPVTLSTTAAYEFKFTGFSVTPIVGVQYTARQFVGTAGTLAGLDDSRVLLDAGLTFTPDNLPITITAECKNCTRVDYGTTYLFGYKYYNTPGAWDVSVHYKF